LVLLLALVLNLQLDFCLFFYLAVLLLSTYFTTLPLFSGVAISIPIARCC
jgi:hypothetical protein